jgi:hypothetical protein
MRNSGYRQEQIEITVKLHALGTQAEEICRKIGISDATCVGLFKFPY